MLFEQENLYFELLQLCLCPLTHYHVHELRKPLKNKSTHNQFNNIDVNNVLKCSSLQLPGFFFLYYFCSNISSGHSARM